MLWDPRSAKGARLEPPSALPDDAAAILLERARVLFIGAASAIWDLDAGTVTSAAPMLHGREDHAAVRLRDGRVLVLGGYGPPGHLRLENLAPAAMLSLLALAVLGAAVVAFRRSRRRIKAALLFTLGTGACAGALFLYALTQIRYPG